MGILNVTPDSFSDGGLYLDYGSAVARAREMISQGATIIDVGGASSRPAGSTYGAGADPVLAEVEMERVIPVVKALAKQLPEAVISVDTFRAAVAEAALQEGAHLINDITALRHNPEIAGLVAEAGAGLALMHSRGAVGSMPHVADYSDVVEEVCKGLAEAASNARAAGVKAILLDPGFGFGKSMEDNLKLINNVDSLTALGYPVMIGISRKSSIGAALGSPENPVPVGQRLYGTLGATAVGVMRGAAVVRTHDVRETAQMLQVLVQTAGDSIV